MRFIWNFHNNVTTYRTYEPQPNTLACRVEDTRDNAAAFGCASHAGDPAVLQLTNYFVYSIVYRGGFTVNIYIFEVVKQSQIVVFYNSVLNTHYHKVKRWTNKILYGNLYILNRLLNLNYDYTVIYLYNVPNGCTGVVPLFVFIAAAVCMFAVGRPS